VTIKIDFDFDPNIKKVFIDPIMIKRVLINLLRNSIEATKCEGRILIKAFTKKDELVVEIIDSGSGIPEVLCNDLFSKPVSSKQFGTGLGLPFCKRAIEMHGGNIDIISEVTQGTTARITLPLSVEIINQVYEIERSIDL
ncbi:ATP-binding protein, partial [Candidatus Bathyarchaeota archaeon]